MPHAMTCDKCGLSEREIEIGTMTSALGNLIAVCPTCAVIERNKGRAAADDLMIRRQRQRIVDLEAALIRIAGHEKSGELWATYNAKDDEGRGEDEPDFEAIMDRLIRIARDALKAGSWFCAEHQVWHSPVAPCPKHPNGPPEMEAQ